MGGRGINMLILYSLTDHETEPLSPESPLIIGAGLLSGIIGPATARSSISGKSPETDLLGDSNIGGNFAAALRRTGFDHLIIRGKAESPIYIYIEDGVIEFRDASNLWGMDTIETMYYFKDLYGEFTET